MRKLTLVAAALACFALPAMADGWSVTPIYSYQGKADTKNAKDEVKTSTYGIVAANEYFTFGYTKTKYDFKNYDDLNLNKIYADAKYESVNRGTWGYFVGMGAAFGWEDDFHMSKNYQLTPRAGINYDFANDWFVALGVALDLNKIENYVDPMLLIAYRDPSQLGLSGSIGTYNHLQYRFSEALAIEGTVNYIDRDVYQLADKAKRGPAREGYFMEKSVSANVGVVASPVEMFTIKAGVEARFDREYRVYDKDGHKLDTYDSDPSYGFYLSGSLNF